MQRVRDPIHGLIVFQKESAVDQLAWQLIQTSEFQRLRRIKQLGVSDHVYPGGVHSRFAHCIGVFHIARKLIKIVEREIYSIGEKFDKNRAEVAVISALLHDLGHGPLSHTFEGVERSRGIVKRHETWTAEIIRNPDGGLLGILDGHRAGFGNEVAALLSSEDPTDIYHAVVSSSFDADRLDYLQRDRLMTGTKAGEIDLDWLIENVRVRVVDLEADDLDPADDDSPKAPTFCIDIKALPAAEQFLIARYTLHEQVYFHKTTRCMEYMIAKLLRLLADQCKKPKTVTSATGLDRGHPLVKFFSVNGATLQNYLQLDDVVLLGAVERMNCAGDAAIAELAKRIRDRRLYKALDVRKFGSDEGKQRAAARRIDLKFGALFGTTVLKDEGASLSIYTQVGADDEKAHKKLRILDQDRVLEITAVSELIKPLTKKYALTRYYFEQVTDRTLAVTKQRDVPHA